MSFNHPKAGPNYVPAYQVSGIPFVTSSVAQEVQGPHSNGVSVPASISFPYVTKFVTVRNTGTKGLRVGFSADGVVAPGERLATVDVEHQQHLVRQLKHLMSDVNKFIFCLMFRNMLILQMQVKLQIVEALHY
jgi:hypothetical protein